MSTVSAYSEIVNGNVARARAALADGETTFRMDLIDSWPGCPRCVWPIRRNVESRDLPTLPDGVRPVGLFRRCGCPGRLWREGYGSSPRWEIILDGRAP